MELENANCKSKISECLDTVDLDQFCIERPLKVDVEITGLEKLIEELHRVFSYSHVNIQDVQKLMLGYKSDPKDWKKYAKYDRFRYTRNLVDEGNGAFNIMILCWGPGHASAIHDHADSHCFMKLLSGSLDEVRYEWPDNVEPEVMKKIKSRSCRRCCSESENITEDLQNCNISSTNGKDEDSEHTCQNGKQNDSCQNGDNDCQNGGNDCQNGGNDCQNGGKDCQNGGNDCQNGNKDCQNGGKDCQNGDKDCQNGDSDSNTNGNFDEYTETYDIRSMKEIGRTSLEVNDVCYINDALGLHRVENPSYVDGAVSLHLYCPPFNSCRVFDARTGKPTEVKVTFWSKYGKKIKRVLEATDDVDSQH